MKNKIFELDNIFQSLRYNFDVLAFTETWFCNKDDDVALHGYNSEGAYRKDRRGGGMSIYIKKGLKYEMLSEFSKVCNHYEFIAVVCLDSMIMSVYRPPSGDTKEFMRYLTSVFEYLKNLNI